MDQAIQQFFASILAEESKPGFMAKLAEKIEKTSKVPSPKANHRLGAYVAEELKRGTSRDAIKKGLLAAHWTEKDVDTALLDG